MPRTSRISCPAPTYCTLTQGATRGAGDSRHSSFFTSAMGMLAFHGARDTSMSETRSTRRIASSKRPSEPGATHDQSVRFPSPSAM